ncbi:tRNA (adenosine(37)-N6)-threonylcarbamoyltransferase complex ATPase subunit type 1 TsaE [Chelativorans sp. AA-79]|uniref:tRNA (adenosine(37)-N6)-threonylcarbamoyltransferase complex ATPase subunit type 1 TsaE n=1 Tax=Chelativorans sp. AA-79 TaxID=3028735 RepID=UPI0023F680E1|nr:tRNA (adenosine(37)-N6)-threonylcarbamoyltransferase complex ATPase subunit type 1 TsaE [Chelativorans sp. AA-79]WEX09431.1 tRNA (adenosine(37)-N6)-threonylcarbamoyltransferase complex ATPase subunit type 1 TsaE [Chelativorans sp. AA-79]
MRTFKRFLADARATDRLGDDLAAALRPGDVVALHGDLGTGKSTLARAIIRAIAGDRELEVPSPTFTLVQSYGLRIPIHHFDLYRLSGPDELEELGLSEALSEGIVLVEWPEQAPAAFTAAIRVALRESGDSREAEIEAPAGAAERIAHSLVIRGFLQSAGRADAQRSYLLGDASIRAYETVTTDGERLILMDAPERRDEPLVRNGLPYSRIARLAQSVTAFVGVANALRNAGFSTPRILAQDLERGLLLTEYLGDEPFLGREGAPFPERYLAAAGLLAALHERTWPERFPVAEGLDYAPPRYDRSALAIEAELLLDWYLPHVKGRAASTGERQEFSRLWSRLFERLERAEQSLVLRDFHSPNIIWREEKAGLDRLGLVDVQDAVWGPGAYDMASLALDARVTIPEPLERSVLDAYYAGRRSPHFDRTSFEEAYAITAAQRNTKLLGIFVRLSMRDCKPFYLHHLPRIRAYLNRVLAHPALTELGAFYREQGFLDGEAE